MGNEYSPTFIVSLLLFFFSFFSILLYLLYNLHSMT